MFNSGFKLSAGRKKTQYLVHKKTIRIMDKAHVSLNKHALHLFLISCKNRTHTLENLNTILN